MKTSFLFSFLLILCVASADPLLTFVNAIDWKTLSTLNRVTKLQEVTYTYSLSNNRQWNEHPGLNIVFHLPMSQYIQISYKSMFRSPNQRCHYTTRLIIDGKQNRLFRCLNEVVYSHNNAASELVWIQKGSHVVYVQYQTDCDIIPNLFSDWNIAYLKIQYLA